MNEPFANMLKVGGKSNSLGKANEVIELVLQDKSRLDELYDCLFDDDAWVRMRAVDALEKICRVHPEWLEPYVDRFLTELSASTQPSIQWHLAQVYGEIDLTDSQRDLVISWLRNLLSSKDIDWIVAVQSMQTLVQFSNAGWISKQEAADLLRVQQHHKSQAVVKKAGKLLEELS